MKIICLIVLYIVAALLYQSTAQEFERELDRTSSLTFTVDHNKTLSVTPLVVFQVSDVLECTWKCIQQFGCWSFNFAFQKLQDMFVCRLLSTDKYNFPLKFHDSNKHHHYTIKNGCEDQPCRNGGTCLPLYGSHYKCNCTSVTTGKDCEFQKLNLTDPVCFSVKDDSFGTFQTATAGHIKSFKLVHVSGGVGHSGGILGGNWGSVDNFLETVITDNANKALTPPTASAYTLPGVSVNDPELNPPGFNPSLNVTAGQKFRVWFTEDLFNVSEHDNHGTSCAHVYAHYEA